LRAAAEARCLDDARVCLEVREEARAISFVVENQEASPQTVRIVIGERHNLLPAGALPFRAVLAPGEREVVGVLAVRDVNAPRHYTMRWDAALGDARARHAADALYRMPFGGKEPRAVAPAALSADESASHALEFRLPWDTPVLAARGGRVVRVAEVRAQHARRGPTGGAMRVDVLHADGTLGSYENLRAGALAVGTAVATGDRIGVSGDGAAGGGQPLRFAVWKREGDLSATGIAIRFHDGSPRGFTPRANAAYAPACASSGSGCAADELPPEPESAPARRAASSSRMLRRADGACACANGAVIHVDLPCDQVCGN
jgi:murein DD-endopeptidase MepM/ murein hydrolase activator NlpD